MLGSMSRSKPPGTVTPHALKKQHANQHTPSPLVRSDDMPHLRPPERPTLVRCIRSYVVREGSDIRELPPTRTPTASCKRYATVISQLIRGERRAGLCHCRS